MAQGFNINVHGIEEVSQGLAAISKKLATEYMTKALAAAAQPIFETLEAITPVETGQLKEHIQSVVILNDDGKTGVLKVGFGRWGKLARLVELGHREFTHYEKKETVEYTDKRGRTRKKVAKTGGHRELEGTVPAHPFMRTALATSGDAAVEAFANSISTSLEKK